MKRSWQETVSTRFGCRVCVGAWLKTVAEMGTYYTRIERIVHLHKAERGERSDREGSSPPFYLSIINSLSLLHGERKREREREKGTISNFISAVKMALMSTPIPLLVLAQKHLFLPSPGEVRRAYRRVFLSLSLRSSGERVTEFE